ncbi:MAG TPA: DUF5131 family protein [Myxococcota bacterium]
MTKTNIEWSGDVWNFLRGCSRVSEGCRNCYAESVALRFSGEGLPYEGLARRAPNGEARWTGDVRVVREKLGDPLRWRKTRLVFVNSMSDLFHEKVPFHVLAAAWGVMAAAPQHTFQILTKRPERAAAFFAWLDERAAQAQREMFPHDSLSWCRHHVCRAAAFREGVDRVVTGGDARSDRWPLGNVHLGVSVEDQATLDERVRLLRELPAWVRWISYEPALGPVTVAPHLPLPVLSAAPHPPPIETVQTLAAHRRLWAAREGRIGTGYIDWVVVGGESGHRARPFALTWAARVVAECAEACVPVFVKQLGAWPYADWPGTPESLLNLRFKVEGVKKRPWLDLKKKKGNDPSEWPELLRVRQSPAPVANVGELVQALQGAVAA